MKLNSYDYYIVAFSGGKDSIACFLHLLDIGIPRNKIELWHHRIDGHEGSALMDWPVTDDYCKEFAKAFNVPIYYSWKVNGFEGELLRENSKTNPVRFEFPGEGDNAIECGLAGGVGGKATTRLQFPQVTASLKTRWCSAYLKIDVSTMAVNNQKRFNSKRTLFLTGERAEESSARAKYKTFEPYRADKRDSKRLLRHIDHWRPVHGWNEYQVWDIIKRYKVNPHPAYKLGWGRLSCMFCIFGSPDQWKSAFQVDRERVTRLIELEASFGRSIHRTRFLPEQIALGSAYKNAMDPHLREIALNTKYMESIFTAAPWEVPSGAYGSSCGPT